MSIQDARQTNAFHGRPIFSLGNKIYRVLWGITWFVLCSWTPPPLRKWRLLILRLFGADVSFKANVYGSAKIWVPYNLTMREAACLGPKSNCYCMAPITLMSYATISQGAHLCTGTHDINDKDFQLYTKPISIGERAWIAAEAFVGPGVTVGTGAVLGARGVAFQDLKPWSVYVGNPAKEIKKRIQKTP
ncbi:MAG: putative colanic acid biosynthesis acetyltransferase [Hyphomicrobiaceae bacterium]|nr:putative colanic acid biosynthesis acetyltransferase [Hyphomicrobiaceae bacterium]